MRYITSSQVDVAGRSRTNLMASDFTLRRFTLAVGMPENLVRHSRMASGLRSPEATRLHFSKKPYKTASEAPKTTSAEGRSGDRPSTIPTWRSK